MVLNTIKKKIVKNYFVCYKQTSINANTLCNSSYLYYCNNKYSKINIFTYTILYYFIFVYKMTKL